VSLRALIWSFDQHDTTPTQRLILLALGNYANADDETWPKVETIVADTGLKKSAIYAGRAALCDSGHLTKLDRRDAYRINLPSTRRNEIPPDGKALDKGTTKEPDAPPERASDDAQRLYNAFQSKVQGKAEADWQPITPSLRRVADKALQEFPLAQLITAIDGFLNWRKQKDGDRRFSSIFASHPGGRPLHDHIAFWISQADGTQQARPAQRKQRDLSEADVKMIRAVRDVQRAFGSQDPDTLAAGEQAMEFLKANGHQPSTRDDGMPYFPSLGGKP
jgi:hypothetical protein